MTEPDVRELLPELEADLRAFVERSPRNAMPAHGGMRIYDAPLVGVAAAEDPLFGEFRTPGVIGPHFMPPQEWLPGARSVICYFLPFTPEVRVSNRAPGLPSEEWVSARIDGEAFNMDVRRFLAGWLRERGAQALVPPLDERYSVEKRVSNWSERHAAYAAGLGTFGLHRALITEKGSAGRLGSVVTTLALPATRRPYARYNQYCLFYARGACGACIRRCPPHAITPQGKDHAICSDYLDHTVEPLFKPRYGCAKCNVGVPCEAKNPTAGENGGSA